MKERGRKRGAKERGGRNKGVGEEWRTQCRCQVSAADTVKNVIVKRNCEPLHLTLIICF